MRTAFACAAGVALCLAAGSCFAGPEDAFAGTTKITLTKDLEKAPAKKTVEITDKAQIAKFLATINLEPQVPAACDHVLHAAFTTPRGVVTVNFCTRCFDLGGKTYRMPAEFYKLFEAAFR